VNWPTFDQISFVAQVLITGGIITGVANVLNSWFSRRTTKQRQQQEDKKEKESREREELKEARALLNAGITYIHQYNDVRDKKSSLYRSATTDAKQNKSEQDGSQDDYDYDEEQIRTEVDIALDNKRWDGIEKLRNAVNLRLLPEEKAAGCTLLGETYDEIGRKGESITFYTLATDHAPNDAHTWYNLGLALYHQQDYAGALSKFEAAIELNLTYKDAVEWLEKCKDNLADDDINLNADYRATTVTDDFLEEIISLAKE